MRAAGAHARGLGVRARGAVGPLRRLGSWVGRHVSPLGWLVLVGAVGALVVGRRYGWDELVAAGATLAALLLISIVLTLGRSTYRVELDLADHRIVVGERAVGRLNVTNVGRARTLPARIVLPVGAGQADVDLPSLASEAEFEEVFAVAGARRSVLTVGPVRSVRGDALGLVRRQVMWTEPEHLYVHPRTVSLGTARTGVLRDLEGEATRVISDHDMSFHALREYIPGDDRRSIHWRSSARLGRLMVRQFEDTRRTHTALGLVDTLADYRDEDEFELAVTVYASIGQQALREELEVTALTSTRSLRTTTPPAFLDDCAGLEVRDAGADEVPVAQEIARSVPHASLVLVVTGSTLTAPELRATASHVPAGIRTVVISVGADHELALQTRNLLTVATLGSVTDLPRLMRRLVTA
ncbi:DUF58 domain-containing protein [Sanguibacter sp. HDW7]|uniref:DUF58 domain-containing protein n=1 Tax=Sanguibacter sp. HDW7 TaxID=2714931 RepID=UPI001F101DA3|nr:DUF58 domain-containing protein [Sanguibacter sp. HDW7]